VTRSPTHLRALIAASALLAAAVLIADLNRLWLAAGPALLGLLDAAVLYGSPARARRSLATKMPGSARFVLLTHRVRHSTGAVAFEKVLAVLAIAAAAFVTGGPVSLPTWLRALIAIACGAALVLAFEILFGDKVARFRERVENRASESTSDPAVEGRLRLSQTVIAGRRASGKSGRSAETFAALLEKSPSIVLAFTARDVSAGELDHALLLARRAARAARQGGPEPIFCYIVPDQNKGRVVIADPLTAELVLSLLRAGPLADRLKVGQARYPEDASDVAALIAAAFRNPSTLKRKQ
jgi:hypothetical protein